MSLAARLARLVRANLSGRFGVNRKGACYDRHAEGGETGRPPTPPPHRGVDPTLAGLYANLELPYGAGPEAVRSARRRLLSRYHPDRFANDPGRARLANSLVQGINHAHDELIKHLEKENHA